MSSLKELQEKIGYSFRDEGLLLEALTHKSFTFEDPDKSSGHNERLEFLGDSIVGLAVAERLFLNPDGLPESTMSKLRAHVVRGSVLSEAAGELGLGECIRLGKGELSTGGRKKKSLNANAFEAVIGAVYLDGGLQEAKAIVLRALGSRIDEALQSGEFHDYKTELQELTQADGGELPEYSIVSEDGAAHEKVFTAMVSVCGREAGRGAGGSKKEAESRAAKEAIEKLRRGL